MFIEINASSNFLLKVLEESKKAPKNIEVQTKQNQIDQVKPVEPQKQNPDDTKQKNEISK